MAESNRIESTDRNDRYDSLRRELEGKIDAKESILGGKIDKKLDWVIFAWIMGSIITVSIVVIANSFVKMDDLRQRNDTLGNRLTAVETRINSSKNIPAGP